MAKHTMEREGTNALLCDFNIVNIVSLLNEIKIVAINVINVSTTAIYLIMYLIYFCYIWYLLYMWWFCTRKTNRRQTFVKYTPEFEETELAKQNVVQDVAETAGNGKGNGSFKSWLKKNWKQVVGGVLLVVGSSYLIYAWMQHLDIHLSSFINLFQKDAPTFKPVFAPDLEDREIFNVTLERICGGPGESSMEKITRIQGEAHQEIIALGQKYANVPGFVEQEHQLILDNILFGEADITTGWGNITSDTERAMWPPIGIHVQETYVEHKIVEADVIRVFSDEVEGKFHVVNRICMLTDSWNKLLPLAQKHWKADVFLGAAYEFKVAARIGSWTETLVRMEIYFSGIPKRMMEYVSMYADNLKK